MGKPSRGCSDAFFEGVVPLGVEPVVVPNFQAGSSSRSGAPLARGRGVLLVAAVVTVTFSDVVVGCCPRAPARVPTRDVAFLVVVVVSAVASREEGGSSARREGREGFPVGCGDGGAVSGGRGGVDGKGWGGGGAEEGL